MKDKRNAGSWRTSYARTWPTAPSGLPPGVLRRAGRVAENTVEVSRDYTKAKRDIERWIKEDQNSDARFTTMFDLYALPGDFPGYEYARQESDPYARVRLLEDALGEDISDQRFVPYLQLHEFEALLFCDPQKLEERFDRHSAGIVRLAQAAEQSNPELINDGNETAPSKRIIREIPEYESDKASSGPIVAQRIGLTTLRTKCQHFAEWIGKLEDLTEGS